MWTVGLAVEVCFFFIPVLLIRLQNLHYTSLCVCSHTTETITPNYRVPLSPYEDLTWQTFMYKCMSPSLYEWKSASRSVWPRQQYRALLIAMLISFIIKDRLCVCRSADCWVKGEWREDDFSGCRLDSGRVEQTGFIFCYWSAVNDLSLCFPSLKAYEHGILVVLHQDTDRKRVYWLFIKFRWGKGCPRWVCWECICLLS